MDISKQHEKKDEGKAARMKKDGITSSKVMLLTVPLVGTPGGVGTRHDMKRRGETVPVLYKSEA